MFNSNPVMALMLPLLLERGRYVSPYEDLPLSLALNRDGFLR